LMQLVQAKTLLPEGNLVHCKLGYCLFLVVGLYFPLSFFRTHTKVDDFPQSAHCLAIWKYDIIRKWQLQYLL
jgi:hypothetical protein